MRQMSRSLSGRLNRPIAQTAFLLILAPMAGCGSAAATQSHVPASVPIASQPTPTRAVANVTPTPTPTTAPSPRPPGKFVATGAMTVGRSSFTATLLLDGRVLVVGSDGQQASPAAELYDPATGRFSKTGSPSVGRFDHTATLLKDGRVLIAGGWTWSGLTTQELASAELYDPSTGKFTTTGSMTELRVFQTATLLQDGRVLITGGADGIAVPTAELYDPSTGTFSAVGQMSSNRMYHTATLLSDGRVLVVGGTSDRGASLDSAELYDPASGTFSGTGSLTTAPMDHVAARLADGRVLVVGAGMAGTGVAPMANLYDPATGTFSVTGSMINGCNCEPGSQVSGLLLSDGRVFVPDFSSVGSTDFMGSAELYDPASGTFSQAGAMSRYRRQMAATLLADGRVLLAGDEGLVHMGGATTLSAENEANRASAELYVP